MEKFELTLREFEEILDLLIEESAEYTQIASKIKRFGLHDHHPIYKIRNEVQLKTEIVDMLVMIAAIQAYLKMSEEEMRFLMKQKLVKMRKFTNLSNTTLEKLEDALCSLPK